MALESIPSPVRLKAVAGPGQPEPTPALEQLYRSFERELLVPLGKAESTGRPLCTGPKTFICL